MLEVRQIAEKTRNVGADLSKHTGAYLVPMPVSQQDLEAALRKALPIDHLEIIDVSIGCGENYAVVIVSSAFEGKMTLARHRMVNELLKDPISQMHAFSQKTFTPKQWEADQLKKKEASEVKAELKTTVAESDPPISTA